VLLFGWPVASAIQHLSGRSHEKRRHLIPRQVFLGEGFMSNLDDVAPIGRESEIGALEEQLRLAMLRSDVSVLDALIADELLFVGPDGSVLGKAADLELHRSGAQRISQLDFTDLLVRDHGVVAVTSVMARVVGTFNEQSFSGQFRYMRTWARIGAGWQVVAGSASLVANPGS
jgi:hypothetical protein